MGSYFNSILSSPAPVMTWLLLWPSIHPSSLLRAIGQPWIISVLISFLFFFSPFTCWGLSIVTIACILLHKESWSHLFCFFCFFFVCLLFFPSQRQCIASNGYFLYCSSRSLWTRRCGSTTPCLWASTCSASCWRESPAPSVRWSSSPPSSSSATVAGAIAFCTTVTTPRCPTRPTTRS